MGIKDANFKELAQVLNLTSRGYIIFDGEEELMGVVKEAATVTICKVITEMADAWEMLTLTEPDIPFSEAIEGLRAAVTVWQEELSSDAAKHL